MKLKTESFYYMGTRYDFTEPHTLLTSIRSREYDLGYDIPLDMTGWDSTEMIDYLNWMYA